MMEYDVRAYKDSKGRWHREIIGPFPKPAGAGGVKENCCTEPKDAGLCHGFDDEESAKRDGSRRVRELEGRS